jgi:hypothetical protein
LEVRRSFKSEIFITKMYTGNSTSSGENESVPAPQTMSSMSTNRPQRNDTQISLPMLAQTRIQDITQNIKLSCVPPSYGIVPPITSWEAITQSVRALLSHDIKNLII